MILRLTLTEGMTVQELAQLAYRVTFTKTVRIEYTVYLTKSSKVKHFVGLFDINNSLIDANILKDQNQITEVVAYFIKNSRSTQVDVVIEGEL